MYIFHHAGGISRDLENFTNYDQFPPASVRRAREKMGESRISPWRKDPCELNYRWVGEKLEIVHAVRV